MLAEPGLCTHGICCARFSPWRRACCSPHGNISSACPSSRGTGTWSCGWATGIGVNMFLAYPVWWKMVLVTHFSYGHFYLAVPVIPKEKTAYKPLELQKSPHFLSLPRCREDVCVVGNRRGQLCFLLCLGDPLWPFLLELQCWRGAGVCCRVMKGTLVWQIGWQACCKKRETLAKDISKTCVSVLVEQLSVLF